MLGLANNYLYWNTLKDNRLGAQDNLGKKSKHVQVRQLPLLFELLFLCHITIITQCQTKNKIIVGYKHLQSFEEQMGYQGEMTKRLINAHVTY